MRRMLLVGAVLCASTSCTAVTQTTVVIEADREVERENPRVTVVVRRRDGVTPDVVQMVPRVDQPFPLRVAIVPIGGDPDRTYEVIATTVSGGQTWETRAISGFVRGERRELRMRIENACRAVACDANTTCRNGSCVDVMLPLTVPGASDVDAAVLGADTGPVPDAAVAPGTDAAGPLGTDAGPVEGCGWQPTDTIAIGDLPFAPLVSVDGGSVFVAYTADGTGLSRGVQMVRRVGSDWPAQFLVPLSDAAGENPRERLFSFRVDMGAWRIATMDDVDSTKRVRTQGGDVDTLPNVNHSTAPQMGWSATSGPRFLFTDDITGALAIWSRFSGVREIVPPPASGAPLYAPSDVNDSVMINGELYRLPGGASSPRIHSGTTNALLAEPDGTLHIIYTEGSTTMHLRVGADGERGGAMPITAGAGGASLSAAAQGRFYWGGRIWDTSGMRSVEAPIPSSELGTVGPGSLVMDDDGGIHVVGRMGSSVRYAYRPPCP